ncbi:MAG TPA: cell division protein FtsL [Burkholderiales bacterium]|nr:cell division protein FtsL [Burkholderiales bacterium]
MIRVNLLLLLVLVGCALGLITSQHRARQLFVQLEKEREIAKQIDVEWGQLQLEQRTWATHARIERIAAGALQMRVLPADRVRTVQWPEGVKR